VFVVQFFRDPPRAVPGLPATAPRVAVGDAVHATTTVLAELA